jgi:hypothetical protein
VALMTFSYRGFVDVVLIGADGSNHVERFPAILNETLPGLFEMSTPYRLPAARGARLAHDLHHLGRWPAP